MPPLLLPEEPVDDVVVPELLLPLLELVLLLLPLLLVLPLLLELEVPLELAVSRIWKGRMGPRVGATRR